MSSTIRFLCFAFTLAVASLTWCAPSKPSPLLLAHYMPWYQSKPFSGQWGWHWTMNHFQPDSGALASQYRPLMGPYDSADPAVLECQCLQMRLGGIDGVLIDWYGIDDLYDYPQNHRNAQLMIDAASRAGLKFAVVFEDQILPNLIKAGKVLPGDAVKRGGETMRWLESNWFNRPGYLKLDGKPVLLVFGPQFYKDPDWVAMFSELKTPPAFFTELGRKGPALGGFGWPEPQVGDERSWTQLHGFYSRAKSWPASIGVAYPRFRDIYSEAGIHTTWGTIEDREGRTYLDTLALALKSGAPFVQIATWNDWGEGTQIEPSKEFGYRDLEATQRLKRELVDSELRFTPADLRLPLRLYNLRKRFKADPSVQHKLDLVRDQISEGRTKSALGLLNSLN